MERPDIIKMLIKKYITHKYPMVDDINISFFFDNEHPFTYNKVKRFTITFICNDEHYLQTEYEKLVNELFENKSLFFDSGELLYDVTNNLQYNLILTPTNL